MLTRTLATLTLLLLTGGADVRPPAAPHLDRARAAQGAIIDDDIGGCRALAPAPVPVPVAPAACSAEGQP